MCHKSREDQLYTAIVQVGLPTLPTLRHKPVSLFGCFALTMATRLPGLVRPSLGSCSGLDSHQTKNDVLKKQLLGTALQMHRCAGSRVAQHNNLQPWIVHPHFSGHLGIQGQS